jgi:hypothetical protein
MYTTIIITVSLTSLIFGTEEVLHERANSVLGTMKGFQGMEFIDHISFYAVGHSQENNTVNIKILGRIGKRSR